MKLVLKTLVIFLIFMSLNIFPKKFLKEAIYKQQNSWFKFISLEEFLKMFPESKCQYYHDELPFEFKEFALSIEQESQPNKGVLLPTFILNISNGIIVGMKGNILKNNYFIKEMVWRNCLNHYLSMKKINRENIRKITGRIAVITQPAYDNYFHWITEILARLALLEKQGIEYDYLYIPQKSKYMRETLSMWGIPEEKIIAPDSEDFVIEAEHIILPSLASNSNHGWTKFVNYIRPDLVTYVRNKLFDIAVQSKVRTFSKKVFISRKDAPIRKLLNEDEIFAQFEKHAFVRYELSKLSVTEQIMLFNEAEIIVSPQGTGLANSIFCTSNTKVIELFQGLCGCTFWYISQIYNLNYIPIQTILFERDYFKAWQGDTHMPLIGIEKVTNLLKGNDYV